MPPRKKETFESNMARLQEIISMLESPGLPLEKGIELYREGMQCSAFCKQELEKARHEVSIWQEKSRSLENNAQENKL